jgi:hypothetical protein
VEPIAPGTPAPAVPGVDFTAAPTALFFFKVTCPVCQMAAPVAGALARAHTGRIEGIGQDPPEKLEAFDRDFGLGIEAHPDLPPYDVSAAYGIRTVPTLFLVGTDGIVLDTVESWDRRGYQRVAGGLAELLGTAPADLEPAMDGLPAFRPG